MLFDQFPLDLLSIDESSYFSGSTWLSSTNPQMTAKEVYEAITSDLGQVLDKVEVEMAVGKNGEVVTEELDIETVWP